MVALSTSTQSELNYKEYVEYLLNLDLQGEIVSIYHIKNDALSDAIVPEEIVHLYGKEKIEEELLGLKVK